MFAYSKHQLISWRGLAHRLWLLGFALLIVSGSLQAAQPNSVTLAWGASTAADVGGYKLYYGQGSRNYTSSVDVGNATSYSVTGLQAGATYYFAVSVYDSTRNTESRYSAETAATVPTPPQVSFTASQASGYAPLAVTFTPTATGTITGWKWDFGDGSTNSGTTSTVPTAIKSYGSAGTYSVSLTATGPGGTTIQTLSNPITVTTLPPTVGLTASQTSGTAPLAVIFTPATTGGITRWQWNFGDGTTSSGTSSTVPTTPKSYASAGTYTASLTVTGPGGTATQTLSNPITVAAPTSTGGTGSGTGSGTGTIGLVAALGFDEVGGTVVADASGFGNHGLNRGAVRIGNGRFGHALNFNGNELIVNNGNNVQSLALSTGMTLEAWVYPTAWMSGGRTIMTKTSGTGEAYRLAANTNTNQPMSTILAGSTVSAVGNTQIPPNQWTHLATTYDGQYQSLYINGNLVNVLPQTGVIPVSCGALRIGDNPIWGYSFNGYIDEVRIYNRALTNAEIINDSLTAISSSNPPQFVVGDQNVEPTVAYSPEGVAQAFLTTAQKASLATNIQVYLDASSTATGLVAGIYSTTADGHPGTLLAQGTSAALKAGAWNSVSIPATSLKAGRSYWIAILGSGGAAQLRSQPSAGTNMMETSAGGALTSLPGTWSTGSASIGGPASAYGAGYAYGANY